MSKTNITSSAFPKKKGGNRVINAPSDKLKSIQSALSRLLLDCLDEINRNNFPDSELAKSSAKHSKVLKIKCSNSKVKQPSVSHGFERNRSIITNAMMHLGRKNVFNLDLENFFGSINFGRVRGFFIKNNNFELHPDIATVIAQIACYKNQLPQGSPCSPVITNLLLHSLDMKLVKLASMNSCIYTRYADDMTFSTRKSVMPSDIARIVDSKYVVGKKLCSEINRSGFNVNDKKTRNQYQDSRQDVTGLIVNQKPNTKKEYWRTVRAQCHSLFKTGSFTDLVNGRPIEGNVNRLYGRLNHIDQIDHYNRLRQPPALDKRYQRYQPGKNGNGKKDMQHYYTGREKTFSKFLFYQYFCANQRPTILTEGETDPIHLKSAIYMLAKSYQDLATKKTSEKKYELHLQFINYTKRTKFLLELDGGSDYLASFVKQYKERYKRYKAPRQNNPVIVILDNDTGADGVLGVLNKDGFKNKKIYPNECDKRDADFIHACHNLYVVLIPRKNDKDMPDIESLFNDQYRLRTYKGKCFNTITARNEDTDLSKAAFATHIVKTHKQNIDFSSFKPLLDRLVKVIKHHNNIRSG